MESEKRVFSGWGLFIICLICLNLSWAVWPENNDLSQVYQNALDEYNLKNYPQVIKQCKRYLTQADPDNRLIPEAMYLLAQSYEKQQQYALALEYYLTFVRNYSDHGKIGDVLLAMGKVYFELKQYVNAQAVFLKVYTDYPTTFQAVEAMQMESRAFMAQNDLDGAEKSIARMQKKYPRHEATQESLAVLGKAWLEIGAFPQARKTFNQLLELDPPPENAAAAYYGLGWLSYREGVDKNKLEEVLNNLKQVVEKYPQSTYAAKSLFLMAEIASEKDSYTITIAKYQQLIEDYPQSDQRAEALFNLAKVFLKIGRKAEAKGSLQKLTQDYPSIKFTSNAYFLLGQSFQEEKDFSSAIEMYMHIITQTSNTIGTEEAANWKQFFHLASENFLRCVNQLKDPEFTMDSYFLLAEASQKIGEYNTALQYYLLINKDLPISDSRFSKASLGQASIYLQKKDIARARQIYENLLTQATTPRDLIHLTIFLAQTYYQESNYDKAIELLKEITLKYPEYIETSYAYYWLGQIYFQKQLYAQAITSFEAALKSKNQQEIVLPEVLYRLAYCYYIEKNYIDALRVLEKSLTRFPNAVEGQKASFLLANLHYELGNYPQATEHYIRITNLFTDTATAPLAQYRLGVISFRTRDFTEAALEFNQFLISYPDHELNTKVRFALGLSYFLAEDWPAARASLNSFINNIPENELTEEALFLLFIEAQNSNDLSSAIKYLQNMETLFPHSVYRFEIKITQTDFQITNSLAILKELGGTDFQSETARVFQENTLGVSKALGPFSEMLKVTMGQLREKHLRQLQDMVINLPLNETKYY